MWLVELAREIKALQQAQQAPLEALSKEAADIKALLEEQQRKDADEISEGKDASEIESLKEQLEAQRKEAAEAEKRVRQLQDEAGKEVAPNSCARPSSSSSRPRRARSSGRRRSAWKRAHAAAAAGLPARLATAEAFLAAVPSLRASKDFAALVAGVVVHGAHVPAAVAALEAVSGLVAGAANKDNRPRAFHAGVLGRQQQGRRCWERWTCTGASAA